MIEETESQEQSLDELIERVEQDDLPTNVFTNEDTDPMVLLGKINEVIGYLRTLQGTIESSDTKATQALASAIQALETANTALSSSTTALTNANQALSTANTAISSANSAVETANTASTTATEAKQTAEGIAGTANQALSTANTANNTANSASATANNASTTANEAKQTAEGIAGTANQALTNANQALSTANTANNTANSASTTATEAKQTANSASTTAVNANITANNANTTAQQALTTAQGKQDQLTQTQLNNIEAVPALSSQVQTQESNISTLSNVKVTKTDTPNKIYGTDSNGDQAILDNDFAKSNLSNVSYPPNVAGGTTNGNGDRVIETYISSDGKTRYRKWASGWKEISGSITTNGSATATLNLPIAFSNTDYAITTAHTGAYETNVAFEILCYDKATNQIKFVTNWVKASQASTANWVVINYYMCGY